ncbi:hypothetical protein ACFQI3_10235 [Hansschlegelia quercus]|uniref:hypothetical protein n=1 Tax=Hansschlegelia quercus TaxID=2528245 RepID=UPI001FDFAB07|nr:hypothetical protein [Hansschlegelia quercus]
MTVETLGDAWRAGWRVKARCAAGGRAGLKSIRECHREYEPDMETLVWTRGAAMPLADLATRLRCPTCRSLKVTVAFVLPPKTDEGRVRFHDPLEDMSALPHRVELYKKGGSLDRLVAATMDIDIARGAYDVAVRQMKLEEGWWLLLRRFGQAVARYPEEETVRTATAAESNAEWDKMREGLPKGRKRVFK